MPSSHRKPRPTLSTRISGGTGLTTAALTTVAALAASTAPAGATPTADEPRPSLSEVQKKVDALYQQAGVATQAYNAAKDRTAKKKTQADKLLDDVARATQKMNDARGELGAIATAQYRTGGVSDTAVFLLADNPEQYAAQKQLMERLSSRQQGVVDDYRSDAADAAKKRRAATASLTELTASQQELHTTKQTVQSKLADARTLLSQLTAEEKARLAAAEQKREEEARKAAEELARKRAAQEAARKQAAEKAAAEKAAAEAAAKEDTTPETSTDSPSSSSSSSSSSSDTYAAKADKVIAFAEAQIGKPYVWGATGPDSYDCSGLTQDAWAAAGITLPRTTWDQVETGTTVSAANAQPGDLVFFYDDISHVGIYIGDGQMIHAPKPGTNVRIEAVSYMPVHRYVRPA